MRTIYGLLLTDIAKRNVTRIPAVLFASESERHDYLMKYSPTSYRIFEYEIEEEYAHLDLDEGTPLPFPNL